MNDNFAIQLFEGKKVRIVWDAEQEKYYFSVTDIVQVLTDSVNPRDYIKKKLQNAGKNVNFLLAWNRPHSGDYALDELFAWIAYIVKK